MVILLLALALRLWGLGWGLPDSMHNWSFHPDETILLNISLPEFGGLNLAAGRLLPHFYHYGTLPFTLASVAVLLGQSYHLIGPLLAHGQVDTTQLAKAYVAARLVSAILGVGTVWAVYALGCRCFNSKTVGLLGAFFLAVCPLHAQHSHFATVDIGAAFWLIMSLVWAAKLAALESSSKERLRAAIIAGVFAGLSAASKYSGVVALLSAIAAPALLLRARQIDTKAALGLGFAACMACAAAFLLACPGSVLETARFLSDTRMESNHVMHQPEVYFQQTGLGWIYIVRRNLDAAMGLPLLILSLAGLIYGCIRRERGDWILLATLVPIYLILGAAQSRYARYDIPMLPLLALWAARLCGHWRAQAVSTFRQFMPLPPAPRWAMAQKMMPYYALLTITQLVMFFTLADCVTLLAPMSQADPRERAAAWIETHVPGTATVGLSGSPWFWSPPLDPNFSLPQPGAWQEAASSTELARFCYNPNLWLDPERLESCRAPYVVLTEYQYADPIRLHWASAHIYLAALRREYGPPLVFQSTHPLGGARSVDGLPVQDLPHDMLYPDPTILIYVRR